MLGICLCLSQLTALRGESAIGPFDVLVVAFASLSILTSLKPNVAGPGVNGMKEVPFSTLSSRWRRNPAAVFWLLTIPVFAVSILINLQGGRLQNLDLFKVVAPFVATAIVTLSVADLYLSHLRKPFLTGFIITSFILSLIYMASIFTGIIDLYNLDGRFIGGSANPNQTGFIALAAVILCVMSFKSDFKSNLLMQVVIVITIICSFFIGRASQSDSFALAIAPLLAFAGLKIAEAVTGHKASAIGLLAFGAIVAVLVIFILQPAAVASAINGFVFELQYGNQDVDRVALWMNGVRAWQDSPIIGHGPGGWSGFSGPFEGVEAHNSYIDWLTIVGVSGFLIYLIFLFNIFRYNIFTDTFRYVALGSILIFGMFGFFLRFPIYWITIMMIMVNVKSMWPSLIFDRVKTFENYKLTIPQSIVIKQAKEK